MGLDMYLKGEKYLWTNWDDPSRNATEDGFRLNSKILDIGYWRKHPDLHGFIVETFADGEDKCQRIDLSENDLSAILAAVKGNSLPKTEGFFFGKSDSADEQNTVDQIKKALAWLKVEEEGVFRSVYYEASW